MYRFDAKTAYYFYPETDAAADKVLYLNTGISYEKNVQARGDVQLIKHGLHIPNNSKSYEDFVNRINKSETDFVNEIGILI